MSDEPKHPSAIDIRNSKRVFLSNVSHIGSRDFINVAGADSLSVDGVYKVGLGKTLSIDNVQELVLRQIHQVDWLDEADKAAIADDIRNKNRPGILARLKSAAARVPAEKVDAVLNLIDRALG